MELKRVWQFSTKGTASILIVPYGIETLLREEQLTPSCDFNCTLWN